LLSEQLFELGCGEDLDVSFNVLKNFESPGLLEEIHSEYEILHVLSLILSEKTNLVFTRSDDVLLWTGGVVCNR